MLISPYLLKQPVGVRQANSHVSVRKHSDPQYVYKMVGRAVSNDPFAIEVKRAMDRVKAVQKSFERLQYISDRVNEGFRVSRGDHTRMTKEFEYLRNRIHRIVDPGIYDQNMAMASNNGLADSSYTAPETVKLRLNQLIDAIWKGSYQQTAASAVHILRSVRSAYLDRYSGNPVADLQLHFEGSKELYDQFKVVEHTVLDFKDELAAYSPRDDDNDPDWQAWVQNAANMAQQRIVDNPGRALASQTDGIEKAGRVLLKLQGLE